MCLEVLCLNRTYMVCLTPPEQIPDVRERICPNADTSRVAYGAVCNLGSTRRDVVATDKTPRGAQPSRAKRGRRRRQPAPKAPPSLARAAESSWDASKLEAKKLPQTQLPQVGGPGRSTHRIFDDPKLSKSDDSEIDSGLFKVRPGVTGDTFT